jgi:Bromodomain
MSTTQLSKSARAYNKTYKPGPPIVPAIIVNRIVQYINKIKIRRKLEFVQLVCRYWSLKREARRGAPLLKRLHLEPWTASGGKIQTDDMKQMKLDVCGLALRFASVLMPFLATPAPSRRSTSAQDSDTAHSTTRDEETATYRDPTPHRFKRIVPTRRRTSYGPRTYHGVCDMLCPWPLMLMDRSADRHDYFKNPVSKNDVPDYFEVVLNPMCWSMIEDRLDKHEYWDLQGFKVRTLLVCSY